MRGREWRAADASSIKRRLLPRVIGRGVAEEHLRRCNPRQSLSKPRYQRSLTDRKSLRHNRKRWHAGRETRLGSDARRSGHRGVRCAHRYMETVSTLSGTGIRRLPTGFGPLRKCNRRRVACRDSAHGVACPVRTQKRGSRGSESPLRPIPHRQVTEFRPKTHLYGGVVPCWPSSMGRRNPQIVFPYWIVFDLRR